MVDLDRRAHQRLRVARPCKLYVPKTQRYLPGSTRNVSAGGALLSAVAHPAVAAGDRLWVGIALTRRQGILLSNQMLKATVVRLTLAADGEMVLALRFGDRACTPAVPRAA